MVTEAPSSIPRSRLALVTALFVVSGAASLVDQVCFSKYLSYVVGATAHAASAVLAAFMGGLALGAHLGGRRSRGVGRPLAAYGVLEIVVGISVAISPAAFSLVTPAYVALVRAAPSSIVVVSVARWLFATLVVLVPTTAMGATLPLLARLVESASDPRARSRSLGILYAANTLGGAGGALASAYLVLPALGLARTTIAAAVASLAVGIIAVLVGRRDGPNDRAAEEPAAGAAKIDRVLGLVAFASGALVLGAEVVFVHLLVLLVGSSAYAFAVIVSIFLVCLFLGASIAPLFARLAGDAALALSLALAALALAATLPVWEHLPAMFQGTAGANATFEQRELVRGFAALSALVGPTALMGLTFPLVLQSAARATGAGRAVGRLTAINTIGAVAGSLIAGYGVLPALGSRRSIVAIAFAFAAVAVVVAARRTPRSVRSDVLRGAAGVLALAGAVVGLTAREWDLARMTGGFNVYFDWGRGSERILSVAEDTHGGVTTVTEKDGVHTLLTNGKFQGNDGLELAAQRFFAHYPAMFVKRFDRALVIGLGTGTTLGTLAAYPFRSIEVAEISPSIVRASTTYFRDSGAGALADPRVHLFQADGRNHLLVSDRKYDLVGIELTSVWFAGAASLYSREFYALVRSRLSEGGVLQQWVQLHHISARDLATVIHTLRLSFAHVALFYGGGQGILVASAGPLTASRAHLDALEQSLGAMRPNRPLASLDVDVLAMDAGLDAFVADAAHEAGLRPEDLVSTDDNLYLEYATPRGNVLPWSSREDLVHRIGRFHDPDATSTIVED